MRTPRRTAAMYDIEIRMVCDSWWGEAGYRESARGALRGPGYLNRDTGIFVPEEDVFDYAMEVLPQDSDLKREFLDWFYSGNWVKEE